MDIKFVYAFTICVTVYNMNQKLYNLGINRTILSITKCPEYANIECLYQSCKIYFNII